MARVCLTYAELHVYFTVLGKMDVMVMSNLSDKSNSVLRTSQ